MTNLLADLTPTVPWSTTGTWLIGLVGAAALVSLGLSIINQWRKAFGRRPPYDEDMNRREKMLRSEIRDGDAALAIRMDRVAEDFLTLQAKRERDWAELKDEIRSLSNDISFIRGKLEKQSHR